MESGRLTLNLKRGAQYIFVFWGLWYVFFNASITLRPQYTLLWPMLVITGAVCSIPQIRSHIREGISAFAGLYILFFLNCVISLVFSEDLTWSFDYVQRLLFGLLFALAIYENNCEDIFFKAVCFFSLIMLACSFIQLFLPQTYMAIIYPLLSQKESVLVASAIRSHAAVGLTNGTSQNGLFMAIGFCVFSSKAIFCKKNRVWLSLIAVFFFFMVFASEKRSYSILSVAIFILLLVFSTTKDQRATGKMKTIFILLIALLSFCVAMTYLPSMQSISNKFMTLESEGDVSNGRFGLYKTAWEYFLKRPYIGIGVNAAEKVLPGGAVHNSYLQWLTEFGIIFVLPPILAMVVVPIAYVNRVKEYLSSNQNMEKKCQLAMAFSLTVLFVLSGVVAMPFQWVNILMLHTVSQFTVRKVMT